jgi:hypothetical protein
VTAPEDGPTGRELDRLITEHEATWKTAGPWGEPPYPPVLMAAAELLRRAR